jgi:hypothetical protein
VSVFSQLILTSISIELKDELLATQTNSQTLKAQLEGDVALTGQLRTAINDLLSSWELEPTNKAGEVARGDALVDQLCYLGAAVRDRVRDALHTRVVCSGFSYDMEVVSNGFITDITKIDAENKERFHALIDEAEGLSERRAKLFEPEVLPPEAGAGEEEGDAGGACEPNLGG